MKKFWSYKLTCIVLFMILYGILMPGDAVPSVPIPGIDKIVHMGMFFVFIATFSLEYLITSHKLPRILLTLLIALTFGITTELLQGFLTTSRACDPKDLLADIVGALLAILCWYLASNYCPSFIAKITKKDNLDC